MRLTRSSVFVAVISVSLGLFAGFSVGAAESVKAFEHLRNQTYAKPDGKPLLAEVYLPKGEGKHPGVLVVHGGAWRAGNRHHLAWAAERLAERDYAAVAIDYRLAPKYQYPAQLEDCQAAVRWMRENAGRFRIDADRIGGYGYSAGAHLVTLLGTLDDEAKDAGAKAEGAKAEEAKYGDAQPADKVAKAKLSTRLQAVVAGGTPANFELIPKNANVLAYWLGGTRGEKPDIYREASPTAHVSADDPPMYFFHGAADLIVPQISPQLMVAKLTAAKVPAKLEVIEKAGHIEAMFDVKALDGGIAFFDEQLKKREPPVKRDK